MIDNKEITIITLKSEIEGLRWALGKMTNERDYWRTKYKNRGKKKKCKK